MRYNAQGSLMNRDVMSVADMGGFSQSAFQYGTARSAAMAGAMTSLGGDASSMMINPAGLGMYRSSEMTFTPMMTIQNGETRGAKPYLNDGANSFSMSNLSTVFNIYESGNSRLISLNMGLGYNKIANLNYEYSFRDNGNHSSIANLFSRQMTDEYVELEEVYGEEYPNWNAMPSNLWGAILGYKTGLTDQTHVAANGAPIWTSSWINPAASVDQFMAVESEGSIGEYDISLGANIDNTLYLGVTLGIQSVYQRLDLMYGEEYNNNDMAGASSLQYSKYNQSIITSGAGVNLKIGATYRPTDELRIGVAYHSPTWYSLNREYQASLGSYSITDGDNDYIVVDSPMITDYTTNKWRFNSPSKVLIGGSYTFASRALLTVDYQLDWYGNMKVRDLPTGVPTQLYNGISDVYQSVNTLKIGGEYKLIPSFALRGGYGISSSMVRNGATMELLGAPTTNNIKYFSAGVGYAPNAGIAFDLTYMNQATEYSNYTLFYANEKNSVSTNLSTVNSARSNSFLTTLKQHNIILSMTLKM